MKYIVNALHTIAPSYANLFIGAFEKIYIQSKHKYTSKTVVYKRYIDNLRVSARTRPNTILGSDISEKSRYFLPE